MVPLHTPDTSEMNLQEVAMLCPSQDMETYFGFTGFGL